MHNEKYVGRPREFDTEEVLKIIMNLFWEKGYEGAGLAEIVNRTGLKKGSLYSAFGNKHAMYLAGLKHYTEQTLYKACDTLRGVGTPNARIEQFLTNAIESAEVRGDYRGCFLCNASADRAAFDPEIAEAVRIGYDAIQQALEAALKEDQKLQSEQVTNVATLFLTIYSGIHLMTKSGYNFTQLKAAKRQAMTWIAKPRTTR